MENVKIVMKELINVRIFKLISMKQKENHKMKKELCYLTVSFEIELVPFPAILESTLLVDFGKLEKKFTKKNSYLHHNK